jgi:hypothetical protein
MWLTIGLTISSMAIGFWLGYMFGWFSASIDVYRTGWQDAIDRQKEDLEG